MQNRVCPNSEPGSSSPFQTERGRLFFALDMKEDIASKLNRELGREIESEMQIVYILVEARKLFEQQKTLDSS